MSDCPEYDTVNYLTMSYLASTADGPVATIAQNAKQGLPSGMSQSVSHPTDNVLERLAQAREIVCRTPFNRRAFDDTIIGLEECAEKRYLMAVATFRAANGMSVPDSAAQDIKSAMRQDPGNTEYLQFAETLLGRLGDQSLKKQIEGERALIKEMKAQGIAEHGRWVY